MPELLRDMWPSDIAVHTVLTPLAILRYQAALLRQKTTGLIEAEVVEANSEGWIQLHFDLVATALDRYRFRLFYVRHKEHQVYPVLIEAGGEDPQNVSSPLLEALSPPPLPHFASTQEEFVDLVGTILRSKSTRSIIQSLIARSNDRTMSRNGA